MHFIQAAEDNDYNGNPFVAYRLLDAGEDWLLQNQEKLELRVSGSVSLTDDDVPF